MPAATTDSLARLSADFAYAKLCTRMLVSDRANGHTAWGSELRRARLATLSFLAGLDYARGQGWC